jgi:hypothetical protein
MLGRISSATPLLKRQIFPFTINIPESAISSFCFGNEGAVMKVRHRIQAICVLEDDNLKTFDWRKVPKCQLGTNMLGDEKIVIVAEDQAALPEEGLFSVTLSKNVREGLGKDKKKPSSFEIVLDKQTFAFGETVKLKVDCNNE